MIFNSFINDWLTLFSVKKAIPFAICDAKKTRLSIEMMLDSSSSCCCCCCCCCCDEKKLDGLLSRRKSRRFPFEAYSTTMHNGSIRNWYKESYQHSYEFVRGYFEYLKIISENIGHDWGERICIFCKESSIYINDIPDKVQQPRKFTIFSWCPICFNIAISTSKSFLAPSIFERPSNNMTLHIKIDQLIMISDIFCG